jgi:hypothetical protein
MRERQRVGRVEEGEPGHLREGIGGARRPEASFVTPRGSTQPSALF